MIERTDEVLAQRFRELGDREALSALIQRNQGPIYGYLLRLLRNPHDAEEAAQEVFDATKEKLKEDPTWGGLVIKTPEEAAKATASIPAIHPVPKPSARPKGSRSGRRANS